MFGILRQELLFIMAAPYIFTSSRLGFRNWTEADVLPMNAINTDPVVMEFFPALGELNKTKEFIARMQNQYAAKGFCYFAVDKLESAEFIGFIGLSEQTFEADFTPCIDIGWRLAAKHWGHGYATEGAERCLDYAFEALKLERVLSMCPAANKRSEEVMQKTGMVKLGGFVHPMLKDDARLRDCVLYEVHAGDHIKL
jgi:RimJ/RimL family protein N-acetyltransferase